MASICRPQALAWLLAESSASSVFGQKESTMENITSSSYRTICQFLSILERDNWAPELLEAIVAQPRCMQEVHNELYRKMLLYPSLFCSLDEQIELVRKFNVSRNWRLAKIPPAAELSTSLLYYDLVARVAAISLFDDAKMRYDPQRTFVELLEVIKDRYSTSIDKRLSSSDYRVDLFDGVAPSYKGVYAINIHLSGVIDPHHGLCARDAVRVSSAHSQLLTAVAFFPEWVHSMNGENVPYVIAGGYRFTCSDDNVDRVVRFRWDNKRMRLVVELVPSNRRFHDTAFPYAFHV